MDKIRLRLINQSQDNNRSKIVIFQKNVTTSFDEIAVAWRVIENLGLNWMNEFTYSLDMQICVSDSYGNLSPQFTADPGELWKVSNDLSGDQLTLAGASTSSEEVQVLNGLGQGAIAAANIYRDGKKLATKTNVAPGQKAVFKFKPSIFIGVVSEVEEGDVIDSAIVSDNNTEISLLGISSADIVMSGGGPGKTSQPFRFTLGNVNRG